MRKLKLQVQMTVDGYIAGPNGEMDWMIFNCDDELINCVKEIIEPVDCIVLGRKRTRIHSALGCCGCKSWGSGIYSR